MDGLDGFWDVVLVGCDVVLEFLIDWGWDVEGLYDLDFDVEGKIYM